MYRICINFQKYTLMYVDVCSLQHKRIYIVLLLSKFWLNCNQQCRYNVSLHKNYIQTTCIFKMNFKIVILKYFPKNKQQK